MSWYRASTISLTNGSTAVTGAATDFIANSAVGEGLLAPDGKVYEIAAIVSATSLTLGSVYLGSTASGQSYAIIPSQSYLRDLAAQAAALVNSYQAVQDGVGAGLFADGTAGAPSVRFATDTNTGINHSTTDTFDLVTGGTSRATASNSGLLIPTVDINGGTIDGTVIGGTTPAAGSFTTLSASGVISAPASVSLTNAGSASQAYVGGNGSGRAILNAPSGQEVDLTVQGVTVLYATGSSVGTLQPLSVTGALSASGRIAATSDTTSPTDGSAYFYKSSTGGVLSGYQVVLETGSAGSRTTKATLDASGNLGLGVTPSAWSTGTAIEMGNRHAWTKYGYLLNGYFDGSNYRYRDSVAAGLYSISGNTHSWYAAPAGTAGNAITFTQVLAVEKDKSLALQGATSVTGCGISFPATQVASSDANTLDDYREGSYTATATGMTTSPTCAVSFVKNGNTATLDIAGVQATSNATTFTLTGMPTALRPGALRAVLVRTQDNGGTPTVSLATIDTAGAINIFKDPAGSAFTSSGQKTIYQIAVSYII